MKTRYSRTGILYLLLEGLLGFGGGLLRETGVSRRRGSDRRARWHPSFCMSGGLVFYRGALNVGDNSKVDMEDVVVGEEAGGLGE